MTKTKQIRIKFGKYYWAASRKYFEINKVPKAIRDKVPEVLLEEYFNNLIRLEKIECKIKELTDTWVGAQKALMKNEEVILKLVGEEGIEK